MSRRLQIVDKIIFWIFWIRQNESLIFHLLQTFENFEFLKVLGKGTFGKVILCREKATNQVKYSVKKLTSKALNQGCAIELLGANQITYFISSKSNKKKVGLNAMANRLYILNGRIPLEWLNLSIVSYKLKCKKEFLW